MFKKTISYLIILSMVWIDMTSAMHKSGVSFSKNKEEEKSKTPSRKLPNESSPLLLENGEKKDFSSNLSLPQKKEDPTLNRSSGRSDETTPLLSHPSSSKQEVQENNEEGNEDILPSNVSSHQYNENQSSTFSDSSSSRRKASSHSIISKEEDNKDENPHLKAARKRLEKAESLPFILKWIYMDHLLEKMAYSLLLRKKNISGVSSEESYDPELLWVQGRGIPLKEGYDTARGITGFRQGVEFVVKRSLSLTLGGLIAYQIYELEKFEPLKILETVWNGDEQSVRGALAFVVQNPEHAPYFSSLFAVPLLWGLIKAKLFARRDIQDTPESFNRAVKVVNDFSFSSSQGGVKGFWNDNLRWVLPFHPIDREVNYLVYRLLLDGNLTLEQRKAGLKVLVDLTKKTRGWSKSVGLASLQMLGAGTSLNQLDLAERNFGADYKASLLEEKIEALSELHAQNPGIRKAGIGGLIHNLYANYLLWTLGDFDNKASALAWAIFKVGTLGITVKFFIAIADQIISYIKCPKPLEQGFNYAMQPSGYSLYNQKCFEAYLSVFNKVPGQPACTLVNLLPKFKLDPTYTLFNLSGAGVTGEQAADLLMGLRQYQPTIHLTHFDLSNNMINTESGMRALFEAFKNITMASTPENGIKTLNLSDNLLGASDDAATLVLGEGLKYLPNLQTLDLSENYYIGSTGDNGTIAIGKELRNLTNLQTLDLSGNEIGFTGDNGTIAIGQGLPYLSNLQILDLSGNWIGLTGDNGTIAIGEGLPYLSNLQTLNLSLNNIGSTGDNGTIAIGEGLHYLPKLQTLDISLNNIGSTGDNGTIAIGQGLPYLSNLQTLDLSGNAIALGFSNLVSSIIQLKPLENLFIQQSNGIAIPSSQLTLLQQFWNHRNNNTDVYALITLQDVQTYLNSLSNNTKTINLSRNFPDPSADLVTLLFNGLARFHDLQILDLSENWIGWTGGNGTIAIGEGLQNLPHLQILDLSGNAIGVREDNGTTAIGKGLRNLTNLQTLDLSQNGIGSTGDNGTIAIGQGLPYLSNLQTLDFSKNEIGLTGDNGTIAIGEGLQNLPHLQILDLSENWIGLTGDNGTIAIGEGLHYLPYLQTLDLSVNEIGLTGDNGTSTIGKGFYYLSHLQNLDLSGNSIGGSGAQGLFNDLSPLICQGLKTLNLQENNFTDISWSEAANALEGLYSSQLQQACEASRCFGTPITVNATEIQCSSSQPAIDACPPLPSPASSLTPPLIFKLFTFPWKEMKLLLPQSSSSQRKSLPVGTEMVLFQKDQTHLTQDSFQEALVPFYRKQESFQPSSVDLFLTSAMKGATYTFGLEMIREGLEHVGLSKRMAHITTTMAQVGMVTYTATSYVPTLAGMAINDIFTYMGVPPYVSSALGTTALIAASMASGDSVSSLNLMVSIGGGLVGNTLALKAKNKISAWLYQKKNI